MANISDHDLEMFQITSPPYWRAERTRRRQQQYAEQKLDRVEYAEDHFTGCSGGTIYDGDAFPQWKGQALIAGMVYEGLVRVAIDGNRAREVERIPLGKRIRAIVEAPDGSVWIAEDKSGAKLRRLVPKR